MKSTQKSTGMMAPFQLVGLRFNPTEEELIGHYLKRKIIRGQSPPSWNAVIVERDLYGEKATPWELFKEEDDDLPWQLVVDSLAKVANSEKVLYVFTKLSNFGSRNKHRVAGCGTWHVNSGLYDVRDNNGYGKRIGTRRTLTFRSNEETVGQWTMHEYAIDAAANGVKGTSREDYVICKIKRHDSKSSKGGKLVSSCKRKFNRVDSMHNDDGVEVEQENHETPKKPKNSDYCSDAGYRLMGDDVEILYPTPLAVIEVDGQVSAQVLFGTINGEIYCALNHE